MTSISTTLEVGLLLLAATLSHIVCLVGASLLLLYVLRLGYVLRLLTIPHLLLLLSSLVSGLLAALLLLHIIYVIALVLLSLITSLVLRILALHAHHFKLTINVFNFVFVVRILDGVFFHYVGLLVAVVIVIIFFFLSLIV